MPAAGRSAQEVALPPALAPLAENLWVATRPLPLVVGDVGTRMTVVRLRDGARGARLCD